MNVISLFDGMSCGRVALERAGFEVDRYVASEIDKYAIAVSKDNYPDIEQIGDVQNTSRSDFPSHVDLLLGGSPCQGFSYAGKQLNFDDPRSRLFFEYVRVLKETNPTYFLLENVNMKKEWADVITDHLGVEPININSSLVSAQHRRRVYWTNIPNVSQPEDRGIKFNDILEPLTLVREGLNVSPVQLERITHLEDLREGGCKIAFRDRSQNCDKAVCVVARDHKGIPGREHHNAAMQDGVLRRLSPVEYERLQTLPDRYTKAVSETQRVKMIGNAWTVDVIAHIMSGMEPLI